jgi:hypothetical protein
MIHTFFQIASAVFDPASCNPPSEIARWRRTIAPDSLAQRRRRRTRNRINTETRRRGGPSRRASRAIEHRTGNTSGPASGCRLCFRFCARSHTPARRPARDGPDHGGSVRLRAPRASVLILSRVLRTLRPRNPRSRWQPEGPATPVQPRTLSENGREVAAGGQPALLPSDSGVRDQELLEWDGRPESVDERHFRLSHALLFINWPVPCTPQMHSPARRNSVWLRLTHNAAIFGEHG